MDEEVVETAAEIRGEPVEEPILAPEPEPEPEPEPPVKQLSAKEALKVLHNTAPGFQIDSIADGVWSGVWDAANEITRYHAPTPEQAGRHREVQGLVRLAIVELVRLCPQGQERVEAIKALRLAKMWASAAIALEKA